MFNYSYLVIIIFTDVYFILLITLYVLNVTIIKKYKLYEEIISYYLFKYVMSETKLSEYYINYIIY